MTLRKARKLIQEDIRKMSCEKLQRYKCALLDAWRYAKGDYGYQNDFFYYCGDVNAYIPVDKWLLNNINDKLDELFPCEKEKSNDKLRGNQDYER